MRQAELAVVLRPLIGLSAARDGGLQRDSQATTPQRPRSGPASRSPHETFPLAQIASKRSVLCLTEAQPLQRRLVAACLERGRVGGPEALDPLAGVLNNVDVAHAVDSHPARLQELPGVLTG